jgi:hypothetical protein
MEVLVRWKCPECRSNDPGCGQCRGAGYLERWMPMDMLKSLPTSSWIIVGRRASAPLR